MDANSLKENLLGLKSKLQNIESGFSEKAQHLEEEGVREKRNIKLEETINELVSIKDKNVTLNIGGKIFKTNVQTLTSINNNLFCKLLDGRTDYKEEIFLDRSYKQFGTILNYMRTQKFNIKSLNKFDIIDLKREAEYYNLPIIVTELEERMKEVEFVKFEWTGQYSTGGTNRLEDISDRNLMTGFCINSPGWIVIELNFEHEIVSCEVGGYNGNTGLFAASNGANAKILTSVDKVNWVQVGQLPSNHGNTIQTIVLNPSFCKYFKINHTSYLGLGFLKLNKK